MKTEDKLNSVRKDYDETKTRINELEELKKSLEKNEIVIKYLLVTKELVKLTNKEKKLVDETQNLKIKLCYEKYGGHFYVTDKQKKGNSWENETMVTCIHCGIKEKIYKHIYVETDTRDCLYPTTEKLLINVHGVYVDDELEEAKKIYDEIKGKFPDATDDIIEEQIALVKKMKGGKLC